MLGSSKHTNYHELERIWKESAVVLPRYSPEHFLEGGRNPRQTSEHFVSWPRFEKGAFQREVCRFILTSNIKVIFFERNYVKRHKWSSEQAGSI